MSPLETNLFISWICLCLTFIVWFVWIFLFTIKHLKIFLNKMLPPEPQMKIDTNI